MELPNATDIELQLALLNAISQCADGTAVADEIRPVVEKALSLHIPIDIRRTRIQAQVAPQLDPRYLQ